MASTVNKSLALPATAFGALAVAVLFGLWSVQANTVGERASAEPPAPALAVPPAATAAPVPAPAADVPPSISPAPLIVPGSETPAAVGRSAKLDSRRRFALGMIETGNNDREIGRLGEVSRYQIMPSVWKRYSRSRYFHDPEVSLTVAQQHWNSLYACFKKQANREPTDFDMYVLWNTTYGYYANRGFQPARLAAVVRERAERFVNLVERGETLVARLGPI